MRGFKLATVVVCYYPNDDLAGNISSYFRPLDRLYVWDNTPGGSDVVKSIAQFENVILLNVGGKNEGLSFAYNKAIEKAEQEDCTHIMTMDQDSRFEHFDRFVDGVSSKKNQGFGMFCPPINNPSVLNDMEVPCAAQSGCVFDLQMIEKIGGFREDFFIGMVDVEMQLRAVQNGYKMLCVGGCNLVHQIGSGRVVELLGYKIGVSDYGPLRHYYDSRNRILMWKEFPDDYNAKGKMKHLLGRFKVMVKVLLFENNKLKKVFAIIRGTWNGIFNRLKPY